MGAAETILADLGPIMQQNNVLLFVILILLFVVGYKLLQTVVRLGLIAILSGVYLVVLNMFGIGPDVTVQRFILFMVLGTGLFIFYSTLATAVSLFDRIYGILSRMIRWAFRPKRRRRKRKRHWLAGIRKQVSKLGGSIGKDEPDRIDLDTDKSDSKEKAIVLDELEDDD